MPKLPEVFAALVTGAKCIEATLRTRYHRGRKKQRTMHLKIEVTIEYPIKMPESLCQEYARDVERRVVNYATSQARAEAEQHKL